jgi:TIR domain
MTTPIVPKGDKPVEIFYSYSHKDEKLRDQLEVHLKLLQRQGLIVSWHDRRIGPSNEWEGEISSHLDSAQLILLLISPDFINSDYIYDIELKRAMERHETREARVIPIILRPCDWRNAPFSKLQSLPRDAKPVVKWGTRDEAFSQIASEIRNIVRSTR